MSALARVQAHAVYTYIGLSKARRSPARLLWRAFEEAPAAEREERVAHKSDVGVSEVVRNVALCVSAHVHHHAVRVTWPNPPSQSQFYHRPPRFEGLGCCSCRVRVCVGVGGVVLCRYVCVCDLLIFLHRAPH